MLASLTLPGGAELSWESEALSEGLVARAVEIATDHGTFAFSVDEVFEAIVAWDAVASACLVAAALTFYVLSRQHTDLLLLTPLKRVFSALQSAATVLDADGRICASPPAPLQESSAGGGGCAVTHGRLGALSASQARVAPREPSGYAPGALPIEEATRRILAFLASASAGRGSLGAERGAERGAEDAAHRGCGLGFAGRGGAAGKTGTVMTAPLAVGRSSRIAPEDFEGGASAHAAWSFRSAGLSPSTEDSHLKMPHVSGEEPPASPSVAPDVRFSVAVLNWVAGSGNPSAFLAEDELLSAVELIWTKLRIPDRVCPRSVFMSWATELLSHHPTRRFHNKRWVLLGPAWHDSGGSRGRGGGGTPDGFNSGSPAPSGSALCGIEPLSSA